MLVLGIETTCDETAAAVVRRHDDGRGEILANVVLSQAAHAAYGGVVPEIAARAHVDMLDMVIAKAMVEAGQSFHSLDGIAAAAGPGLIGGVIVGLTTAKAIALVAERPLIAVNHLEAHALTARLTDDTPFPYCLFLASGGHTQIVAVRDVGDYVRLGTTLDDALGEAFDKAAKLLGLGYPGGPEVEHAAARGDAKRFFLPRPMVGRAQPDFSLSGLKTALRIEAEKVAPLSDHDVADLCAAFQDAVLDIVTDRLRVGLRVFRERFGRPTALVIAGGVAANQQIRHAISRAAFGLGTPLVAPPAALCTDNGAIIAWAGAERLARGLTDTLEASPRARWPLQQLTAETAEMPRAEALQSPVAPPREADEQAPDPADTEVEGVAPVTMEPGDADPAGIEIAPAEQAADGIVAVAADMQAMQQSKEPATSLAETASEDIFRPGEEADQRPERPAEPPEQAIAGAPEDGSGLLDEPAARPEKATAPAGEGRGLPEAAAERVPETTLPPETPEVLGESAVSLSEAANLLAQAADSLASAPHETAPAHEPESPVAMAAPAQAEDADLADAIERLLPATDQTESWDERAAPSPPGANSDESRAEVAKPPSDAPHEQAETHLLPEATGTKPPASEPAETASPQPVEAPATPSSEPG